MQTIPHPSTPVPLDQIMRGLDLRAESPEVRAKAAYGGGFEQWVRTGAIDHPRLGPALAFDGRALGTQSGSIGGFLVPDRFASDVRQVLDTSSVMVRVATVRSVESGEALAWPGVNDTSREGEIVRENQPTSESDASFLSTLIPSYMLSSKLQKTSHQLLQDMGDSAQPFLADLLGRLVGRALNRYATIGAGSNELGGIAVEAPVGDTGIAGTATSVTLDSLESLEAAVASAYRFLPSSGWLMAGTTLSYIRALKDAGTGQKLVKFERDETGQSAGWLLDHRCYVNDHMPALAANNRSIVFGDLSSFCITLVGAPVLLQLRELYAGSLAVGWIMLQRAGSALLLPSSNAVAAYVNGPS